jgi:UDPglucose 6-dehydrogenase
MKRICVIGTGYVGLVTGACFAELGNAVHCVDIDEQKVKSLRNGVVPFYEPGLNELVQRNSSQGRLAFTTSLAEGMADAQFVFIAVGTPPKHDGEADLRYVREAAEQIADNVHRDVIVINKSTVPVETGDLVDAIIRERCTKAFNVSVASNPEFLREGCAIGDFMHPDRVVIGVHDDSSAKQLCELYAPLDAEIIVTDVRTAEMVKYTANAFLATKISFTNEIANICQAVGADIKDVVRGAGADRRIGTAFMNAGLGFGGSCFPKDVQALQHIARNRGVEPRMLHATLAVNAGQVEVVVQGLESAFGSLQGKKVAVLGLAFKSDTDDIRESRSIALIQQLLRKGAVITAHDPVARDNAEKELGDRIAYAQSVYAAASGADAVIIATEWTEYKQLDLVELRAAMSGNVLFDARNLYDFEKAHDAGLRYFGIGRRTTERRSGVRA